MSRDLTREAESLKHLLVCGLHSVSYRFLDQIPKKNNASCHILFPQEPDLRYLVENIWNSQSVLSAHEDLFDLVLVRWKKYEEWSPWNCILLTKEEASAHAKLENVTEVVHAIVILLPFFTVVSVII